MVTIECPWCELDVTVAGEELAERFACPECGLGADIAKDAEADLLRGRLSARFGSVVDRTP